MSSQDWDTLRFVLAIARDGGMSGAARTLGVTHATVSRQLAKAETAAGVPLFTRLATGLRPTEAGREAAKRAEAIEAQVLALDLALAGRDERIEGPLGVTAPPLIMDTGLAGDIAAFHADYPGVDLSVMGQDRVLDLHRREADVAIRVSRAPSESLWGRKLTDQRAGWFASPDFVARHDVSGADPVPIVAFDGWSRALPSELANVRVVARSDDMVSAAALARAGMAMVRMPLALRQGDAELVEMPDAPRIDYWPIWALTHPDLRRNPRVRAFIQFLGRRFAQRRSLYCGAP